MKSEELVRLGRECIRQSLRNEQYLLRVAAGAADELELYPGVNKILHPGCLLCGLGEGMGELFTVGIDELLIVRLIYKRAIEGVGAGLAVKFNAIGTRKVNNRSGTEFLVVFLGILFCLVVDALVAATDYGCQREEQHE